jgi:hypothetical protein
MRKVLLASAALVALASFSAPAFAEDSWTTTRAKTAKTQTNPVTSTISTTTAASVTTTTNFVATSTTTTNFDRDKSANRISPAYGLPNGDENNIAYVEQIGVTRDNYSSQQQVGDRNLSVVTQKGFTGNNEALVEQDSQGHSVGATRNVSVVTQDGNGNEIKVVQKGKNNVAVATQTGTRNGNVGNSGVAGSLQDQNGTGHLAVLTATGYYAYSTQDQDGSDHISSVVQNNPDTFYRGNTAKTVQTGESHEAFISQEGYDNQAESDQSNSVGSGNLSVQIQVGNNNGGTIGKDKLGAYVKQSGNGNTAGQVQFGNYNYASIDQSGTGNTAAQIQINNSTQAKNRATAIQHGEAGILAQIQTGSSNTAEATQEASATAGNVGLQVQTGSNGKVVLVQANGGNNQSTQFQGGTKNYATATQRGSSNVSIQRQN